MIEVLQRQMIDDEAWNSVIEASSFENIYPYTWYLDAAAENWIGLIMNDYECIMPVVIRNRFGLKYAYMPRFCQQLGVFSAKAVDPEIVRMFLHKMTRLLNFGDYSFNEGNLLGEEKGYDVNDRVNYILPLNKEYSRLKENFTAKHRRSIEKASENGVKMVSDISLSEMIEKKRIFDRLSHKKEHYDMLLSRFTILNEQKKIIMLGAELENELCAGGIFALSRTRIHYLLAFSSEKGKKNLAMFHVLDQLMQQFAGEQRIMDFEGSSITSIAKFFRGFGASPQLYQQVIFNDTAGKIARKVKNVRSN